MDILKYEDGGFDRLGLCIIYEMTSFLSIRTIGAYMLEALATILKNSFICTG